MSKTLIRDVVMLTRDGWRPYTTEPDGAVYDRLHCTVVASVSRNRPYWFVKGDIFLCMGCSRRCTLSRPAGFIPPLPIKYPQPKRPYTLTPAEMVTHKTLLRVDEAAYCLNVSDSKIRKWIAEGRLVTLKEIPVRLKADSVAAMMQNFDE